MAFDHQYLKQLKKPLKSNCLSLNDYFNALDRLEIRHEEPSRKHHLTQEFLDHFNHLLQTEKIISSNGGQTCDKIGLKLSPERKATIINGSNLARGEADPTPAKRISYRISQIIRHPMVVTLVGAATVVILGFYL